MFGVNEPTAPKMCPRIMGSGEWSVGKLLALHESATRFKSVKAAFSACIETGTTLAQDSGQASWAEILQITDDDLTTANADAAEIAKNEKELFLRAVGADKVKRILSVKLRSSQ